MNAKQKLALNTIYDLGEARDSMKLTYYLMVHCPEAASAYLKDALTHLRMVNKNLAAYHNAPDLPGAGNPHHSGYLADDETRPTACPHCGNEDYDSEMRCQRCGLWDMDNHVNKRFRLLELINGMDIDDLNTAFAAVIESVVM